MISTALLAMIYLSFVSLGLPDSLLGSAWPSMAPAISAPLWGAGLVQMTISFGTIVSSLCGAKLIRRLGTGRLTALSVATTALALLGFSFAQSIGALLLLAVPLGLGAGAVDTALNNYVALHCKPRHMSWLHCFWGVGTTLGPMALSALLRSGFSWAAGYRLVGALQCLLSAALFLTLPLWAKANDAAEAARTRDLSVRQVLALPGAKQGMLTFVCYCSVESTLGLWAATYLVVVRGMDAAHAASLAALFYVGITAGRAASGFMTLRFSPRQMVSLGLGVLLCGAAMMALPQSGLMLAGLLLCGLGCAPIYPNIIQDTPVNYGAENSQSAVGVQMASAYVGSTFMPTIFGRLARALSYAALPGFAMLLTAAMALLFSAQKRAIERARRGSAAR